MGGPHPLLGAGALKLPIHEADVDEYLEAMGAEQRLIYEFEIRRTYGSL